MGALPDVLVDAAWLQAHLDQPDLRVVECTVHLAPAKPDAGVPYHPLPGREAFEAGHIPGAVFADLVNDLSRRSAPVHFMLPEPAAFAREMARIGVGDGRQVVIYSRDSPMWATRLWWMLRVMGFDDAAVLDGGFEAWEAIGGPLESGPGAARTAAAPAAQAARRAVAAKEEAGGRAPTFTPRPRLELMVDKGFVLNAIVDPEALLINTLRESDFRGEEPSRYGRPGRIPGSVNLPWPDLLDERGGLLPLAEAERRLTATGAGAAREIVGYCGGGISATMSLFQLHRLGYRNLRLYDASMAEWAKDPDLPIECG